MTMRVSTMTSSRDADRILQALLEVVGDKFNAEVEAHINERSEKKR
jgi:hypothetical protein